MIIEIDNGTRFYEAHELHVGDVVIRQETGTIFIVGEAAHTPQYSGKCFTVLGSISMNSKESGKIYYEHELDRPGNKWTFRKVNAKLVVKE
jgi:hypothetical protein